MATPLDTVTIVLSGDVSLADFAKAITHFNSLVGNLSVEVGGTDLDWVIHDLEISSTLATARGFGERERVEKVVRAYGEVGTALERGTPIPYSERVRTVAQKIKGIVDGKVESVRFETAEREAIIRGRQVEEYSVDQFSIQVAKESLASLTPPVSYGTVEGRIQTLTNRGGLRFTLYDLLLDKAVSCYLQEGYENIMRESWGKLAVVTGFVTRDPLTGRPLSIREVSNISIKPEETGDYRDARGVAPALTDLSPENAIRKIRNA